MTAAPQLPSDLAAREPEISDRYARLQSLQLNLDLTRGKPGVDQLALADDTCNAARQYQLALSLRNSTSVSQSLNAAQWRCDNATPTPSP